MITDHFHFRQKTETCFSACLESHLLYCPQFHNVHVNAIAIHKVSKDLKSDMVSRQNWYIGKNSCLIHSKFPSAIEEVIAVRFLRPLLE